MFDNENIKRHNFKPGYYWFDSMEERESFLNDILNFDRENDLGLGYLFDQGENTRTSTLCKIIFEYKNELYKVDYNFGFGYPKESARYMFEEGNYSCDCNRSIFISERYKDFQEFDCGQEIKMKSLKIVSGPIFFGRYVYDE